MAIERYDTSEVETSSNINAPRFKAQNVDLSGLAGTLEGMADIGFKVAQQEKAKADSAAVSGRIAESQNFTTDYLTNPETGIFTKKGKDAIGIDKNAIFEFDKRMGEIQKTLTNDTQRRAFIEHTRNNRDNFILQVNRHEFQEIEKYHIAEADAVVDSQFKQLSLNYKDPKMFNEGLKDLDKWLNNAAVMRGMGPEEAKLYKEKSVSTAYTDRIKQTANDNPMAAMTLFAEYEDKIEPKERVKLKNELKPLVDSYSLDGILGQVDKNFADQDPDGDYGIDKRYQAVKELTKDPHIRDLAYKELERGERLHNQAIKDNYDNASGTIFMEARKAWNENKEVSVKTIMNMPEFGQLREKEQEKILEKVDSENMKIESERRRYEVDIRRARAEERSAAAAARSARAAERQEQREIRREREDSVFNHYNLHPEELASMKDSEFEALAGDVSHADFKTLTAAKKKLNSPAALSRATVETGMLTNIFAQAGITDAKQVKEYSAMARNFIVAEQKEAKHVLSPEETKRAIIAGLQHVAVNVKTSRLGIPTGREVDVRRRMTVKEPGAIIIPPEINTRFNAIEQKRGIKLTPERRRMLYDEMLKESTPEAAREDVK